MSELKFAKGIYPKLHKFQKLSIKKDEFIAWLSEQEANEKGYVNLNVNTSQNDASKQYVVVDTWKPNASNNAPKEAPKDTVDDLPF